MASSKDRVLTAARLGRPDRVPVVPQLSEESCEKVGEETFNRILKETDPLIGVDIGIDFHGIYFGREGQDRLRTEKTSTDTIYIIDTPGGELRWAFRNTGTTVAVCEHMFKDMSDVDKLLSILSLPYSPPVGDFEKVYQWREKVGDDALVIVGMSNAIGLPFTFFGDEEFLIRCMTDMPLIHEMLERANENVVRFVDVVKPAQFEIYRVVGGEYASESFVSPAMFQTLIPPYDKPLCDAIRNAGGISLYHMHDRINALLEDLADVGMDILEPVEAPPCGNVSLADAKKRIGDRVCLMGNVDDMTVMESTDVDTVRRMSVQRINEAKGDGGFILGGTASGIFTPKIAEAFLAMGEVSRSMPYQAC